MRRSKAVNWAMILLVAGVAALLVAGPVVAEDGGAGGASSGLVMNWLNSHTHAEIMLWVNFLILVSVIVKFGKEPMKNFLRGRREEISKEIESLEWDKEKTVAALQETRQLIAKGDAHIKTIKDRILEEGERVKQRIIEDAKKQRKFMLADARRKVKNQFTEAQKTFRTELIDMAVAIAFEKVTAEINDDDQQQLLENYFDTLAATGKIDA